jgi:hypothetical protein
VLGPDGRVYSVPYEIPYLFWIDPATDEIGYQDISTELAGSGSTTNSANDSWYSYGITYGDAIYMAPQKANYAFKISFPAESYPDSSSDSASDSGGGVVYPSSASSSASDSSSDSSGSAKSYSSVSESQSQP